MELAYSTVPVSGTEIVLVVLFCFFGISTIVGYSKPNHVFTYVINVWFVYTFCRYTELNDRTVPFLKVKFSPSQQNWMVQSIGMYG